MNAATRRDFRMLWLGETVSAVGTGITGVALPLIAVVRLHAGPLTVGVLIAASWLPWLLIGLPAGAWVDRLARRPLMLLCDLASFVLFASVPVAAALGVLTTAHLLIVALLAGCATVFFRTAYQVYLPSLVPAEDLLAANTRLIGSESAAQVAGPGVGGLVAQLFGAVGGVFVDALTYLVSAVCLYSIRTPEPQPVHTLEPESLRRQIADGMRFVRRDPFLLSLTVAGAASNIALTGIQAVQVIFLVRVVGLTQGSVGGIIAVISLGGVMGALAARRISLRFGTARGFLLSELVGMPFALLLPFGGPGVRLGIYAVGAAVVGAGVVAGNVIKGSFRQAYCPPELLGRITSCMQFVNLGAIPVGALAGGLLGAAIGARNTLWVMALLLVCTSWLLLIGPMRRTRDFPAQPVSAAGGQVVETFASPAAASTARSSVPAWIDPAPYRLRCLTSSRCATRDRVKLTAT
ncbi:MAG: MFS transporter [Actinomycetota bacterium]